MPVTPNGTEYTVHAATLGTNNLTHWAVPVNAPSADVPLLVYTHGNTGAANQFTSFTAWAGLRNWWLDHGGAYVEGYGNGSEFGNQGTRDQYEQSVLHVMSLIDVGQIVVLARSMGGIVGYWLASKSPVVSPKCTALIVSSGTTNLTARVGGPPGYPDFRAWFGLNADGSNFEAVMNAFDPMRQPLADWSGRKVMQLWGTADTTVDPDVHGKAWAAKYGAAVALLATDERPGGDHTQSNGSYLQTTQMTSFITAATGIGAAPGRKPVLSVERMFLVGGDRRLYPVVPAGIA